MTLLRALPLLILTVIAVALLAYTPSGAADDNRVAVVIDFGNDQVATRCVSFSEQSITGFEALERTGLAVETDFQTGGAAICRIDGHGCPANDCFCSCRGGGDCVYWSYWHLTNGVWGYSAAGSGLYQVTDGAVEGWVWGLGSVTQAQPPPVVAFADVCAAAPADTPTSTATATITSTPIILPTAQPTSAGPAATSAPLTATSMATVTVTTDAPPTAVSGGGTAAAPPPTAVRVTATLPSQSPVPLVPTEPVLAEIGSQAIDAPVSAAAAQPVTTDEATPVPPPDLVSAPAAQPSEPTGGLLAGGAADPNDTSAAATATPIAVSVIGSEADAPLMAGPLPATPDGTVNGWPSYAGFAGLLLLLGALTLLVYRRRGAGEEG